MKRQFLYAGIFLAAECLSGAAFAQAQPAYAPAAPAMQLPTDSQAQMAAPAAQQQQLAPTPGQQPNALPAAAAVTALPDYPITQQNVPVPQAIAAATGQFPELPPSRPCEDPDIRGVWQLREVYESPQGIFTSSKLAQPFQYYFYKNDKTYHSYKSAYDTQPEKALRDKMNADTTEGLQQFIMHQSGILFFYKDGQLADSQACFIVTNGNPSFAQGQMILMPPVDMATSRLARVYVRLNARPKNNKPKGEPRRQPQSLFERIP